MPLDLFILIFSSIAIGVLGLIVFVRNVSDPTGKRFVLFSLSIIGWIVFNYLSDHAQTNDLLFTRLAFTSGVLVIATLYVFVCNFPSAVFAGRNIPLLLHYALTAILIPVTLTPSFVSSVGDDYIETGGMYPLFILYVVYSLVLYGLTTRRQLFATERSDQKKQIVIVFGSIALYAVLTTLSNVLIPLVFDSWATSRFGPVFSLIFVAAIAYSIVKHRLFNIKFVVVRSIGYVLSLFFLAGVSFVLLTGLSSLFDRANTSNTIRIDIFALVTILLAISFQPFKRLFEKLTNKIFYKDAYDTRALLDEFNRVIVSSTVSLEVLLRRAARTIDKFIKPQGVHFFFPQNKNDQQVHGKFSSDLIEYIDTHLARSKDSIIVTDALSESSDLKLSLQNIDVGMVARIIVSKGGHGYMMLGYKKSGDAYSTQDSAAVKILANGLSIAVQNAMRFEEIQSFNVTLGNRVNEATAELRAANERLRKLDHTKDDFISMASHQLRTPLTSVKGYVSMVLDGDAGKINDMQRKLLMQSFLSAQRMVHLISDLLNVSRLKTGKFVIELAECNLDKVIEEEMEQLTETAKGHGVELTYHKPKQFPVLMLDETKLRQVIMNFVDNAIYYTPSGGHIDVYLEDGPDSVEFRVVDDGIGVPKREQHHLFTKFYRAHNAKSARPDGTGLGLFMAKKVVVAQGGAIIFKSTEGKGSTFGFTFPKAKLLPQQAQPAAPEAEPVAK